MHDVHAHGVESVGQVLVLEIGRRPSNAPDPVVRNPPRALALAELAPDIEPNMEALAAALHRHGRFDEVAGVFDLTAQLSEGRLRKSAAYYRALCLVELDLPTEARIALDQSRGVGAHTCRPMRDILWLRRSEWLEAEAQRVIEGD